MVMLLNSLFYCTWFVVMYVGVNVESFDFDIDRQNFSVSQTLIAGLKPRQSNITLCSGIFYSRFYVMTSCRCLFSFTAIPPFFKERIAHHYYISLDGKRATDMTVSKFVMHPFCLQIHVMKPYKNHFGLVLLEKELDASLMVPQIQYTGHHLLELSHQLANCTVLGHHSSSGDIRIGTTNMVFMNAEECLFRLCVPKIGCVGKKDRIDNGEDFCLRVVGDVRLEAKFMEGSPVLFRDQLIGIVVSPGNSRYQKVPTIVASVSQFLTNLKPVHT